MLSPFFFFFCNPLPFPSLFSLFPPQSKGRHEIHGRNVKNYLSGLVPNASKIHSLGNFPPLLSLFPPSLFSLSIASKEGVRELVSTKFIKGPRQRNLHFPFLSEELLPPPLSFFLFPPPHRDIFWGSSVIVLGSNLVGRADYFLCGDGPRLPPSFLQDHTSFSFFRFLFPLTAGITVWGR